MAIEVTPGGVANGRPDPECVAGRAVSGGVARDVEGATLPLEEADVGVGGGTPGATNAGWWA